MIISLECFGNNSGLISFEHGQEHNKKTNKVETIDTMKFNEKISKTKTIQVTEFKYLIEVYNENKIICKIFYFTMKEFKIIINNNYLKIVEFKKD